MGTGLSFEQFNRCVRRPEAARGDSYLNAPYYYLLTGRKGAWVHEGYGAVLVVCKHPHIPDRLLVFPEIGPEDRADKGKLTVSVLSGLTPPSGGVQLARFTDEDMARVKEALAGKNDSHLESIQKIAEDSLDWRYPVHVLDTEYVAKLEGGSFAKIRNKCRQVEGEITFMTLDDPRALRAMKATLKYWEGNRLYREEGDDTDTSFYDTVFAMIEKSPLQFGGCVFMQGKRPVGFTVYDRPFMGTSNLLANLCDAAITGLADYQIVTTCRQLALDGVTRLNFGGSETEGLDAFKRKFNPRESFNLASGAVQYGARTDMNVRSSILIPDMV